MVSALARKSITDLSRHRSRTFFSVVTLALAVASIGLLALPNLMNRAMDAAVASDRLPDVTGSEDGESGSTTRWSRIRSSAAGCTSAIAVPLHRSAACPTSRGSPSTLCTSPRARHREPAKC